MIVILLLAIVLPIKLSKQGPCVTYTQPSSTSVPKKLAGLQYNVNSAISIARNIVLNNNITLIESSPSELFTLDTLIGVDSVNCHAKCDSNEMCLFVIFDSNKRICKLYSPEAAYFLVEDRTVDLLVRTSEYIKYIRIILLLNIILIFTKHGLI